MTIKISEMLDVIKETYDWTTGAVETLTANPAQKAKATATIKEWLQQGLIDKNMYDQLNMHFNPIDNI